MAENTVHTAIFVKYPTIFQHYDERVKGIFRSLRQERIIELS